MRRVFKISVAVLAISVFAIFVPVFPSAVTGLVINMDTGQVSYLPYIVYSTSLTGLVTHCGVFTNFQYNSNHTLVEAVTNTHYQYLPKIPYSTVVGCF